MGQKGLLRHIASLLGSGVDLEKEVEAMERALEPHGIFVILTPPVSLEGATNEPGFLTRIW